MQRSDTENKAKILNMTTITKLEEYLESNREMSNNAIAIQVKLIISFTPKIIE